MKIGVPEKLPWDHGLALRIAHVNLTARGAECRYMLPFSNQTTAAITPMQLEKQFQGRPGSRPGQDIVTQDKYSCMAAAIAMCTGHTHTNVKRALGRHGWRNDDSGAPYEASVEAVRDLGFDMIWLGKRPMYMVMNKVSNAVVTVPSLNYEGRSHALAWVDGEILDPNWDRAQRLVYGSEWTPWTIGANGIEVILKPLSKMEYLDLQTVVWYGEEKDVVQAIEECAA